jgi:DNA polymerase III delta prime subunit
MANNQNPFPPSSLNDFVISDPASKQQLEAILNGRLRFPIMKTAICLWGSWGTGKTTLAKLLPSLLELGANLAPSTRGVQAFASQEYWNFTPCGYGTNSVAMVQDLAKRSVSDLALSPSGWHYEILDEVDMLTPGAQGSLKSAITNANSTIFIMTTNHLNKLDRGLIDRSIRIEMNEPKPEDLEVLGRRFLSRMGVDDSKVTGEILHQFATASRGSIRDFGDAVITLGLTNGGTLP